MMNILAWIILGVVAGAIAKALYPGRQGGGFLGTMILGIIGSFVGGILHTLITTGELALASGDLLLVALSLPSLVQLLRCSFITRSHKKQRRFLLRFPYH